MNTQLQQRIQQWLSQQHMSAKELAERCNMSYPTLLSVVHRGHIPRKAAHRDALRQVMGIAPDIWLALLTEGSTDEQHSGPANLQQLLKRHLLKTGQSEQQFAQHCDVSYNTIHAITSRGSIPRKPTLDRIREYLNIDEEQLQSAIDASRAHSSPEPVRNEPIDIAQEINRHLGENSMSLAQLAKNCGVGYMTLSRLLSSPTAKASDELRDALAKELGLSSNAVEQSLANSHDTSIGVSVVHEQAQMPSNASPLQRALLALQNRENLSIKVMAERANLSQLTLSRIIRGQQTPNRSATHNKLQGLLGLQRDAYLALLHPELKNEPSYETADDELIRQILNLDSVQRAAVARFVKELHSSPDER